MPRSAAKIASLVLGTCAALLGASHGYFEILQGDIASSGVLISARGAPCVPTAIYHACWPAMTLAPTLRTSGMLAILASGAILVWVTVFIGRRHGPLVLGGLSAVLLGVGGGFVPPLYGILAAVAGAQIDARLSGWRARIPRSALWLLARCWPWLLVACFVWTAVQMVFGGALSPFLSSHAGLLFVASLVGLVVAVAAALAHDLFRRAGSTP